MRVAVLQFPGANCDQDALFALRDDLKIEAEYVWHQNHNLDGFDGVFVPGGFTYGDYLRCGAIAARSPILAATKEFAESGKPVFGACNGFQILCEAGLLPGALLQNEHQKFLCKNVWLKAVNTTSRWTANVKSPIEIPIAHNEGRYVCDAQTLDELQKHNQIAFFYTDEHGKPTEEANFNGSTANIAGVLNRDGNVLGMMPHPERATNPLLGLVDGLQILKGFS